MQILYQKQISQKIKRLAIEILEHNYDEDEIILVGINNNGLNFAQLIANELIRLTEKKINITRIRLNPAAPTATTIQLDLPILTLQNKSIIVVDDVANTGRTLFYAIKPLLEIIPKKIETAVLVDRKHKAFPIAITYCGLSLATTLHEHIEVRLNEGGVFLN
jgi:pyrimidine operon attenuation protein / uracil phosphoribosyltransferase